MKNNLSLTSAMRNNLLSIRNISKQMNSVQNIISTGLRVNSAIDNSSNYYDLFICPLYDGVTVLNKAVTGDH